MNLPPVARTREVNTIVRETNVNVQRLLDQGVRGRPANRPIISPDPRTSPRHPGTLSCAPPSPGSPRERNLTAPRLSLALAPDTGRLRGPRLCRFDGELLRLGRRSRHRLRTARQRPRHDDEGLPRQAVTDRGIIAQEVDRAGNAEEVQDLRRLGRALRPVGPGRSR